MDPVSAISIAAAATQFTEQAATIFKALFDYCREVKHAPKQSKELRGKLQHISEVLDEVHSALEGGSTIPQSAAQSHVQHQVEEFATTMKDMATHLKPVQKSEVMRMLKWPFTQKENEEYLAKFQKYEKILSLALATLQR